MAKRRRVGTIRLESSIGSLRNKNGWFGIFIMRIGASKTKLSRRRGSQQLMIEKLSKPRVIKLVPSHLLQLVSGRLLLVMPCWLWAVLSRVTAGRLTVLCQLEKRLSKTKRTKAGELAKTKRTKIGKDKENKDQKKSAHLLLN